MKAQWFKVLVLLTISAALLYLWPTPSAETTVIPSLNLQAQLKLDLSPVQKIEFDLMMAEFGTDCDFKAELSPAPTLTKELAKRGKLLYASNCAECHGSKLDGKGNSYPDLAPQPTDLRFSKNYKYGSAPQDLGSRIAYGIEGTGMAPWSGILTDNEIWEIVAYLEAQIQD